MGWEGKGWEGGEAGVSGLVKDFLNPFDTVNESECQLNNCLY